MDTVDGEEVADETEDGHAAQHEGSGVGGVRQRWSVLQAVDAGGVEVEQLPVRVVRLVHGVAVFQRQQDAVGVQVRQLVQHEVHHGAVPQDLTLDWQF